MTNPSVAPEPEEAFSLPPGIKRRTAKRLAGLRIAREDFTVDEQVQRWSTGIGFVARLTPSRQPREHS